MGSSEKRAARHGILAFGALAVLLLGLALWQLGGTGWIYAKAGVAQALLERAWAARLAEGKELRPWPGAETRPVARLQVPALDVDLLVLTGTSERTLALGPGHIEGTVAPGEAGHSVLTGNRDTHFGFLRKLEPGTLLWAQRADGIWRRFRVTGRDVFDSRKEKLTPGSGWPVLSLVTDWPAETIGSASPWRYVVTAEAVAEVARPR